MGFIVGGPSCWKSRQHGDLLVAFHWVNQEPAMVLFPLRRRLGAAAYIIPLESAHTYANREGYPTAEAIGKCVVAAQIMAMDTNKSTIHGILTAILDNLEDLVKMPPQPRGLEKKSPVIGEGRLIADGETIAETEIGDLPAPLH